MVNRSVETPTREPLLKGKPQYSFDNFTIIYFFTQQATLMRRSTVMSLPVQLVSPVAIVFSSVLR